MKYVKSIAAFVLILVFVLLLSGVWVATTPDERCQQLGGVMQQIPPRCVEP